MNIQKLPSDIVGLSKVMPPLSRRGFMSSSAATAAGYTLAAGPVRADAIQTDAKGLKTGMADVAVTGGNMPVYFARPADVANPPVILVCMEIFGLHEWVKDITRRVGHLGAFAIAPNYYFRAETGGVDLTKMEDMKTLFPIVNDKTDTAPKSSLDLAAEVKEPVLGLYGEADTGITPDQVKQMEAALKVAGKTAEFHEYPGAPHGFVADYRPSYNKDAAEGGWKQMTAWFKKYGVLS